MGLIIRSTLWMIALVQRITIFLCTYFHESRIYQSKHFFAIVYRKKLKSIKTHEIPLCIPKQLSDCLNLARSFPVYCVQNEYSATQTSSIKCYNNRTQIMCETKHRCVVYLQVKQTNSLCSMYPAYFELKLKILTKQNYF